MLHQRLRLCVQLRVGLDYGEEVHWSQILGQCNIMICYEMGPSLIGVHITTKTFLVEDFKHGRKMTWIPTWQQFWLGEFPGSQVSWATSNPWTRNLASRELQLEAFLICFFSSCSSYQLLPQIALSRAKILDWPMHFFTVVQTYEQGEPAASYRCTSWVWELTGWSSRVQQNHRPF